MTTKTTVRTQKKIVENDLKRRRVQKTLFWMVVCGEGYDVGVTKVWTIGSLWEWWSNMCFEMMAVNGWTKFDQSESIY